MLMKTRPQSPIVVKTTWSNRAESNWSYKVHRSGPRGDCKPNRKENFYGNASGELAVRPSSRWKTRHPVDAAFGDAASSQCGATSVH